MADKLALGGDVITKLQHQNRRVDAAYRADTKAQVFPFAPPLPIIDLVDPASGMPAGGSTVTITGAYYSTASAVRFGTTAASFTIINSTTIVATVPAAAAGNTTVTVTNATGVSNAYPFSYVAAAVAGGMETPATWNATPYDTNTWMQVAAGMVVRSGYPASVIENDALVVSGGGPITGSFYGEYTTRLGTQQFRVVRTRDGVPTVLATANRNVVTTFTDTVVQGDRITLECFYSTQYRNVSAGSFVQYDPT